jgi:nitrate reductase gamma subunit
LVFRIHVSAASVLSAMQPFTQLVSVFSAPVGYLTRYCPEPAFASESTSIHWPLQALIR